MRSVFVLIPMGKLAPNYTLPVRILKKLLQKKSRFPCFLKFKITFETINIFQCSGTHFKAKFQQNGAKLLALMGNFFLHGARG